MYRLAHESFAEQFSGDSLLAGSRLLPRHVSKRHGQILDRLLAGQGARPGSLLDPYLSAYAGAAGRAGWQALAEHPAILDQLDPDAVASDALRTGFGRYLLLAAIAGFLTARHLLRRSAAGDRADVRVPGRRAYLRRSCHTPVNDRRSEKDRHGRR